MGKGVKEEGGSGSKGVGDRQKGRGRVEERSVRVRAARDAATESGTDRQTKAPFNEGESVHDAESSETGSTRAAR